MWRPIEVGGETVFIKYERRGDVHEVILSNVYNIWMETLTSLSVSKRCKEMNSFIEEEVDILAQYVYKLIVDGEEGMCITCDENEKMKNVYIKSQVAGIPFNFMFKMVKMDENMICKELTVPLMLLAVQQRSNIKKLSEMLIAKDQEIQQYKLEGAVLRKRKVETEPFSEDLLDRGNMNISSKDVLSPDYLFKNICFYLPSSVNETEEPPESSSRVFKCEPEVKQEPIEDAHLVCSTINSSKVEELSTAEMKQDRTHTLLNKKRKFRI